MPSSRIHRRFSLFAVLVLLCGSTAPVLLAQEVCQGFDKEQQIMRLGSRNAFSKDGVKSPADLETQLREDRASLEAVLGDHGLGHLTDAFLAAVAGNGLSERNIERGESFEWMALRKDGKPTTTGRVCFASSRTFDAYVVEVEETDETAGRANCSLKATVGECPDRKISLDTSGSSGGVEVTMSGPGGQKSVPSSWSDSVEPGSYTFTVQAEATGSTTVTTHTFVIPKVCLNIAYAGKTSKEQAGAADSCQDSETVEVANCLPDCALEAPASAARKESFTVSATGYYDSISLQVKNEEGEVVEVRDDAKGRHRSFDALPATFYVKKPGDYTLAATATNDVGSAECTRSITIVPGDMLPWTVRVMGFTLDTDDDQVTRDLIRPDGVHERSILKLDGGTGLGLDIERHLSERVGIQASVEFGDIDAKFEFDLDNDWDMDDQNVSYLAITLGANIHLTPSSRTDFYIGPFVGFADLGSATFSTLGETTEVTFGDEFLFGALLGLDIPFGGDWGLHLGVRWMDFSVEAGDDVDINPLVGEVGFFWSF